MAGIGAGKVRRHVDHLYYASNYFDFMYRAAEALIGAGLAYVDEQTPSRCAPTAATSPRPAPTARSAPHAGREPGALFREMRDGRHADGAMVLRAKIDMASPNINLRDPAIYRIKRAHHHNTGDRWCIYPMYTYAHPIEDALERITHSICTLEFEDQRPFYDWVLENAGRTLGLLASRCPAVRVRAPEPDLRRDQQAQADADGRREDRQRLGRPAHAHARRHAPARLARRKASACMAERTGTSKTGWLDRLQPARHRAARRPRRQGAARWR